MNISDVSDTLDTQSIVDRNVHRSFALMENLAPKDRNVVAITIIRKDGSIEELAPTYNSRTDAGALWQAGIMGNATGAASAQYIALSSNASFSALHGDTVLSTEITTAGLGRAIATYGTYTAPASLNATASYVMTKTFSATGTIAVYAAGLLNAASTGTLVFETAITSASLVSGDSIALTWTITI